VPPVNISTTKRSNFYSTVTVAVVLLLLTIVGQFLLTPKPTLAQEAECRDTYNVERIDDAYASDSDKPHTLGWTKELSRAAGFRPVCGDSINEDGVRLSIIRWDHDANRDRNFYFVNTDDSGRHVFSFGIADLSVYSESELQEEIERGNILILNNDLTANAGGETFLVSDPLGASSELANAESQDIGLPDDIADSVKDAEESDEPETTCEDGIESLGWIVCPVTRVLGNTLNAVTSGVENLLEVPNVYFEDNANGENPIEDTWAAIRNIAFIVLVPITLVMVVSTALGFEVFSAYTVKKSLPRLVIATIFIALSWEIVVFGVDFVNTLGRGVAGLITSPIGGFESTHLTSMLDFNGDAWLGTFGLIGAGGAIAAGVIGGFGVVFISLAIFVMFILTVFLLLLLREILIVALAIFAPIAILAWIFPADTKLWSLWRGSFVKLLLLYPLIMFLIAAGRIVAFVVSDGGNFTGGVSFQRTILVLMAYIGPFFFIPTAFKYAGSVFGNIAGMVNNKEKGLFDRGKKLRGGIMKQKLGDAAQGKRWSNQSRAGRTLNRVSQSAAQIPRAGLRPSRWRGNIASGTEVSNMQQLQEIAKHPDAQPIINDDEMLGVAIDGAANGWSRNRIQQEIADKYSGRFKTGADQAQAAANIERYLKLGSRDAVGMAATVAKTGTKTGYKYDPENNQFGIVDAISDIQRFSGGDSALERSAIASSVAGFSGAKRYDQAGAGVGGAIEASSSIRRGESRSEIGKKALRKSLTTQGPGAILAGPKEASKPLVDEKLRMLEEAHYNHKQNPTDKRLEEAFVAELASADSLVDMGGQAAPEVRDYAAEKLLGGTLDGKAVSQMVDEVSASPETADIFGRYKRNYKKQYGDDAERMRRQGLPTNQPALFEPPDLGAGPPTGA